MKFILNDDKLTIDNKNYLNSGSVKYYEIEVNYNLAWENLTIEAKLIKEDDKKGSAVLVIDNKVYIDRNIKGNYFIGFVGYEIKNNEKVYQISTNLINVYFQRGAGEIEINESEIPSTSQWEIYTDQIQDMVKGLENEVQLVEEKLDHGDFNGKDGISPLVKVIQITNGTKIIATDIDGTTQSYVYNGITPVRGVDYWTASDIAIIEQYCSNYIDENITQAIGGSY